MEQEGLEFSQPQKKGSSLTLRRQLDKAKKSIKTDCFSGSITILLDDVGTSLRSYIQCFSGKNNSQNVVMELSGALPHPSMIATVGFEEELPDLSIPQYLLMKGLNEDEIEELISRFELKNQLFLTCAQLQPTEARQIQLIAAIGSQASIVILNDPFLPFNGRWRETFAEFIYEDCLAHDRIYICTNLSFTPQSWGTKKEVITVDVAALADRVLQPSEPILNEKTTKNTKDSASLKQQNINEKNEHYYRAPIKITIPIPDSVLSSCRSIQERVFEHVADVAVFLREWSSGIFFISFACISIIAGAVLTYNVGGSKDALSKLILKISEENEQRAANPNPPPIEPEKKIAFKRDVIQEPPKLVIEEPPENYANKEEIAVEAEAQLPIEQGPPLEIVPLSEESIEIKFEEEIQMSYEEVTLKEIFSFLEIPWEEESLMSK